MNDLEDKRTCVVDGPDDTDPICINGYRSCVVDGCRPLPRVHGAGVIVPPAPQVACMWCGDGGPRGQCDPCAALLDAIHAAPRAGVAAIVDATRSAWEPDAESERGVSRSPAWWAEHTVVRLVVTHINAHGARVLFAMPGRELTFVAETAEHAERQLAYVRDRWPEGIYEVREVRFWRDANGSPGDPVHTLVEEPSVAGRTSLRDVLRKAHNLVDQRDVVIMRAGSDYQVRLSGRGLTRVEMRYIDDDRRAGIFQPACSWFTFEGFSVEAALADDWKIIDE